ncbi:MAG: DUF421 domain-containing protein [Candidatus Anstonellaceae archaeon]
MLEGTDAFTQIIRILLIYVFTLAMLRIAGKRRMASLSPFDILIIIALGSAVGDAMLYSESVTPLRNAIMAVFVVVLLQIAITKLTEHHPLLSFIIHGKSREVIKEGRIIYQALEDEDLNEDELLELLRGKGVGSVSAVKSAVLERSGDLGIILYDGSLRQIRRKGKILRRR